MMTDGIDVIVIEKYRYKPFTLTHEIFIFSARMPFWKQNLGLKNSLQGGYKSIVDIPGVWILRIALGENKRQRALEVSL